MKEKGRNVPAAVHARLLAIAHTQQEEFQRVLVRYGIERLLYRLSRSPHAHEVVLKGAALFQIWTGQSHRPTRDVDLLGSGTPTQERWGEVIRTACITPVEEDGLQFQTETLKTEDIREDDRYHGVRIKLTAKLGKAQIPLQVDVGFGDAITPGPVTIKFPTLLGDPAPVLAAYPMQTTIAEKYEALVTLGMTNSRMKDYYDLWFLAKNFEFVGPELSGAMEATFHRRQTEMPEEIPLGLSAEFSQDSAKAAQWKAFVRNSQLEGRATDLGAAVQLIRAFLWPPTTALVSETAFLLTWRNGRWNPAP